MAEAELAFSGSTVHCRGNWTAEYLHPVERVLAHQLWPGGMLRFNLSALGRMDSLGAWLLSRTLEELRRAGHMVEVQGAGRDVEHLLALVAENSSDITSQPRPVRPEIVADLGRRSRLQFREYVDFVGFVGEVTGVALRLLRHPARIRVSQLVKEMHTAGVSALSIVGLLSFLIGVVLAYQGGIVLKDYGANIYVADIVGLSMVRELAPLITAIIVAGRTGSAYTAQIGAMIVTDEVNALRSLGIAPLELLVIPKLFALVLVLPLLTVYSDVLGVLGGLVMSSVMLDLNPATYINRLEEALTLKSYLSGVGKAPVFAAVIALVGSFQGFRVFGGAESVGRQTTLSVVQAIFLVILIDGLFSVAFSNLGI